MKRLTSLFVLLAIVGCQKQVAVPTAQELVANQALLAEWQAKCDSGEYSHLPAADKTSLCATTQEATVSLAEKRSGEEAAAFYGANIKRK